MTTSATHIIPHLHFRGEAAKAIAHYQAALGAEVLALMHWRDMPSADGKIATDDADKVMHAALQIGEARLLIADKTSSSPEIPPSNGTIMIEFSDPVEMQRRFDALAVGGKVRMPIEDAFWGAKFGMLDDAFGVAWMFHSAQPKPA